MTSKIYDQKDKKSMSRYCLLTKEFCPNCRKSLLLPKLSKDFQKKEVSYGEAMWELQILAFGRLDAKLGQLL